MKTKMKQTIRILIILVLSCSFIFLTACSTLKDWWGYDSSASQMRGNNYLFANSDLNQFYSSVRLVSGTVESDYQLARYFQKRGKHKFAVDELLKAIQKDPSYVKAYNALGVSYDHLGQFDLAVKSYKFAIQLNPKLDYVYNNLGYSYLLNGDFDAAIDTFQKAIALNNSNKRYHNNLGLAYARKGRTDLAYNEFKPAGDESSAQHKMAQPSNDRNTSSASDAIAVETSPEGITPYDDIPKEKSTPSPLAVKEQPISTEVSDYRLIPDDFTGVDVPEKFAKNEITNSTLYSPENKINKTEDSVSYTVQVSALHNLMDATLLMEMLAKKGYPCAYLNKVGDESPFYRVRLGRFSDKEKADRLLSDMTHTLGNHPFIAFEDEYAEKLVTGKQKCFKATVIEPFDTQLVNIEISNGNGVRHMARNIGIYLNPKGFKTIRLTNADHFNYPETKIYYQKGYRQNALRLAQEMPGRQKAANIIELNQTKRMAIKVLIGKDLVPFYAEIKDHLKNNSSVAKVENPATRKKMKDS